jgi:hypothetical protein
MSSVTETIISPLGKQGELRFFDSMAKFREQTEIEEDGYGRAKLAKKGKNRKKESRDASRGWGRHVKENVPTDETSPEIKR